MRRPPPLNLREGETALFAADFERVLPATCLEEYRGIRISADGLLFKGPRILPESFAFPRLQKELTFRTRAKLAAINFGLRARRRLDKRAIWITDTWSAGYFHWLSDALPRLSLIRDLASESVLVLPHAYRTLDYVQASLEAFRIEAVEFIGTDEVFLCRSLIVPGHTAPSGHHDEQVIGRVRAILLRRYGAEMPSGHAARIYVSRALAKKRRILNEPAVVDVLRARNFHIVQPERLSFRDQAHLFSMAGVLVSNHGAGLTNMLFMPEGATVLELRHESDAVNNCYFTLAAALRTRYFYQSCASADPLSNPHAADLLVDIDRLAENLDLMLG